jgi:hypothetical protein
MTTNDNQILPTIGDQIMDKSTDMPSLEQQITINDDSKPIPLNENDSKKEEVEPEKMETIETKEESEDKQEKEKGKEDKSFLNKILCIFSFIRPYFKVTFNDIKLRIISSFIPIKNTFIDIAVEHPDLYGPFWIYTTLIYVIAAGGALSYYFTNSVNNYFQAFVPVACSILYTFGFGFPLLMYLTNLAISTSGFSLFLI